MIHAGSKRTEILMHEHLDGNSGLLLFSFCHENRNEILSQVSRAEIPCLCVALCQHLSQVIHSLIGYLFPVANNSRGSVPIPFPAPSWATESKPAKGQKRCCFWKYGFLSSLSPTSNASLRDWQNELDEVKTRQKRHKGREEKHLSDLCACSQSICSEERNFRQAEARFQSLMSEYAWGWPGNSKVRGQGECLSLEAQLGDKQSVYHSSPGKEQQTLDTQAFHNLEWFLQRGHDIQNGKQSEKAGGANFPTQLCQWISFLSYITQVSARVH